MQTEMGIGADSLLELAFKLRREMTRKRCRSVFGRVWVMNRGGELREG